MSGVQPLTLLGGAGVVCEGDSCVLPDAVVPATAVAAAVREAPTTEG